MAQTSQLRIPGPTPVPSRVQRAMDAPMINHRGPEFKALLPELEAGLKWAFQTENDMLIFPASGTGGGPGPPSPRRWLSVWPPASPCACVGKTRSSSFCPPGMS